MREGDVLIAPCSEGFSLTKVLRMTDDGDGCKIAHVLTYQTVPNRPTMADLKSAQVCAWHAPIDERGLESECEVIGNVPVARDELVGYLEYLKQTNVRAYCEERGLSLEESVARAQAAYEAGNGLCERQEFAEAIQKYAEAIEAFPLLFEAHDNRAFALMDMGRYREAVDGFAESLRVEPNNPAAMFSLGECYMKLGNLGEAVRIFRECATRWPDKAHHRDFLAQAEALLGGVAKQKPWWRLW